MNSISSFENSQNPLHDFFLYVGRFSKYPETITLEKKPNIYKITLPNNNCQIIIQASSITVKRADFDEKDSSYCPNSVPEAKDLLGVLSGVCREYGCNFAEADNTVHLIYRLFDELKSPNLLIEAQ